MNILNDRQTQILRLVSEGLSDQSIAIRLGMSIHTIKWHNRQIYHRIDVASRTQAVAWARQYLWDQAEGKQRHNLPPMETTFEGRENLISQVSGSIKRSRLTTLVGPPGIGKTRVAVETGRRVLEDYAEGVWFINLAPCVTAEQFWNEIANLFGVRTESTQPLATLVARRLHRGRRLLILDNAEQVNGLAEAVESRLLTAPSLRILVTSRHPLGVYGEQELPVPPLDPGSSVSLFLERARAVEPEFDGGGTRQASIISLSQRLEGIPLSIELAAARVRLLSPEAILERFERRLDLLSVPGRSGRTSSLRDAIETSYRLLKPEEALLFRRLSVFKGSATLEAIEEVCGETLDTITVLEALLSNSLLRKESSNYDRFCMFETIREYAYDQLDEGEASQLNRLHAQYYCQLTRTWGGQIRSNRCREAVELLESERKNWQQALEWSSNREPTLLWQFTTALGEYWLATSRFEESRSWLLKTIEAVEGHPDGMKVQTLMQAAAVLIYTHSETDKILGRGFAERALEAGRRLDQPHLLPWAMAVRAAYDSLKITRADASLDLIEQAARLAGQIGDRPCQSLAAMIGGRLHYLDGNLERSEQAFLQGLELAKSTGERRALATALGNLGIVARRKGHLSEAEVYLVEALRAVQGEPHDLHLTATLLIFSVGVLLDKKEPELALRTLSSAENILGSIKGGLLVSSDGSFAIDRARVLAAFQGKRADRVWLEGHVLPLDDAVKNLLNYWERSDLHS